MTWRFPDDLAAALGLPHRLDRTYTLSAIEFAGRFAQYTGAAEAVEHIERDAIVVPLALAAARAVEDKARTPQEWLTPLQEIAWQYGLFAFNTEKTKEAITPEDIGQWAACLFYVYFIRTYIDYGDLWFDAAAARGWAWVMKTGHYENLARTIDPLCANSEDNPDAQPRLWHAALAVYQRWYTQETVTADTSDLDELPFPTTPLPKADGPTIITKE